MVSDVRHHGPMGMVGHDTVLSQCSRCSWVCLWLVLQAVRRRGDARQPMESAEEILRQRYARGEIDREAFLRMLDDLKRGPSSRTSPPT